MFGASSHGEIKTLAIIVVSISTASRQPKDQTHDVWVVVDAAVDFQIIRRPARQPLHKATDSSLGTQALQLWARYAICRNTLSYTWSNRNLIATAWVTDIKTCIPITS